LVIEQLGLADEWLASNFDQQSYVEVLIEALLIDVHGSGWCVEIEEPGMLGGRHWILPVVVAVAVVAQELEEDRVVVSNDDHGTQYFDFFESWPACCILQLGELQRGGLSEDWFACGPGKLGR
jgi:hypothetical protein